MAPAPPQNAPLKIVVFFSGGASSFKYLLENDPNYGKTYLFSGVFTDNPNAAGLKIAASANIPVAQLDFSDWRRKQKASRGLTDRPAYFQEVIRLIKPFQPDLLLLSGFMLIVTEPLLSQYRILNVHPADLTRTDKKGHRLYAGLNVVEKAIQAGDKNLCSTVHWVSSEVDGGEVVALSDPFPVRPDLTPDQHQELMKTACDGPAYAQALARVAAEKSTGLSK